MDDYSPLIIACAFWIAGYAWGRYTVHRDLAEKLYEDPEHFHRIAELSKRIRKSAEHTGQVDARELRAEWLGDRVFLYAVDTGQFMGQGLDIDHAVKELQQTHPGTYYVQKD